MTLYYKINFQSPSGLIEGQTAVVTITETSVDRAVSAAMTKTFGELPAGKIRRFLRKCAVIHSAEPAQLTLFQEA